MITALQVLITVGVFGYLFKVTDVPKLLDAFHRSPGYCIPAMIATLFALMLVGAFRWRILFIAYGAVRTPPFMQLFKLQLIGLFYNMLPGAVGGDVVRGVVSRDAFGERGISSGLAVVLIERLLGLVGLMLLVLSVLAVHPMPALHLPTPFLLLGIAGGLLAVACLAIGRRLARFLPGKLGELASNLPELQNVPLFVGAVLCSMVGQSFVGLVGHIAVSPLAPEIHLAESLVLAPISFAAIFFPFTVAGAGTRDAAMIYLYGLLGVPQAIVLSASLEILLSYLLVAGCGGVLSALPSMRAAASSASPESS
ncbi:MAG TPA: lysylphosphatidylglycerol synthase domain-containing protein [Polyangiales bacterium]|nr:lysylphosphatidylglycerol synthase domain-containing protein [Polyangiales bacterium]